MSTKKIFLTALTAAAVVLLTCTMIIWGVSLPSTAGLWISGPVRGWALLIFLTVIFDGFLLLPLILEWPIEDEIKNMNNKK